jgi:biopolymer transport protein ExbD
MLGLMLSLLIFMTMLSPSPHHTLPIHRYLAHTAIPMPAALREDALMVMETRDGTTYFGNSKVANEDLPELARQRVRDGAPRKVYLVVDSRTKYGDVSAVLDEVRHAGISDVAFLVDGRAGIN